MNIHQGEFVYALSGRDAGKCFIVVSQDGDYLYLSNGKGRKISAPKKKKAKHVRFTGHKAELVLSKLLQQEEVTNNEIKRAVRRYTEEI